MMLPMAKTREYLEAYDNQLRTDAETLGAVAVRRLGPLQLVTMPGGRGFVTYRDLGSAHAATIAAWVGETVAHYRADAAIKAVEWKTREHDHAPGLRDTLLCHGFRPEEPESIMIGEASLLTVDVPLPDGVTLRQVTRAPEVHALCAMQHDVFGDRDPAQEMAHNLLLRLRRGDGMQLWVAEAGGQVVSGGRLDPVPGTDFASIWGGATRPEWRKRGIYRALTAARARSALTLGKRLLHSDSTEYSRPILERAGLVKVSTTTPYVWQR